MDELLPKEFVESLGMVAIGTRHTGGCFVGRPHE